MKTRQTHSSGCLPRLVRLLASCWLPRIWVYDYAQKSIKVIFAYPLAGGLAVAKRYRARDDSYPRFVICGWHIYFADAVFVCGLGKWVVEPPLRCDSGPNNELTR